MAMATAVTRCVARSFPLSCACASLGGSVMLICAQLQGAKTPRSPETTLELAYIRDPKLFDRDASTRRSKARADLKAQTGWGDEQIEGWKIMLERNVSSCFRRVGAELKK